jgi:DNA-binding GntR family transcriptional regulator
MNRSTMTSIESIQRRSLHEELVERLRDMILADGLEAGAKVPERELCERLGVSRTPMREALKVLASEGLVTLIPNRGAVVRALTREDVDELFPVIGALEALAGELACRSISDDEIEHIEHLHDDMLTCYRNHDRADYFQRNQEIHAAIVHAANNRVLTEEYRALSAPLRRARFVANLSEVRWAEAVEEHEAMLIALKARDGEKLANILRSHLKNKHQAVMRRLDGESIDTL